MSNDSTSCGFPGTCVEALAMLYLKNQDLSKKSPEDIQTMYYEAYYALKKDYAKKRANGWFRDLKESE